MKNLVLMRPSRQTSKFTDLHMCYCGYEKCKVLHSFGPVVRPNYIIHYILEGKGKYCVGDRTYDLSAGQGFLIEPEVQTFYQADVDDPWTYIWIGFEGTRAREYLSELGLNGEQLTYRCDRQDELKNIVMTMLKNNTFSTSNEFLWEGMLYAFFSVLAKDMEVMEPPGCGRENFYVSKALEFVQTHYAYPIRVSDIANYVCINRSYLYTLFEKALHVSPQEYLANFRLTRAAELLSSTALSVESVALSSGYRDPLVFAKAFKQKTGETPSQYRQRHNQENSRKMKDIKSMDDPALSDSAIKFT